MDIKLKIFNDKEKLLIDPSSSILVVGSRRSGKTTYSKYLVEKIKHLYSLIIVFTHTKSSRQWNNLIPEKFIIEKYNPEIIENIIERNKILKKNCPDINRNTLVIFDDVIDDSSLRNDDSIKSIFTIGRWNNIGILFLTQYLNAVSPTCRNNSDIVICCIQNSNQAIEILYNTYGIIDKQTFINLLNENTKDYNVFIIRNDINDNNPIKKYFRDKAI